MKYFTILMTLFTAFLACTNQYKRYGVETIFRNKGSYASMNDDLKEIYLQFKDEYNISNRDVMLRIDTFIIYYGPYFSGEKLIKASTLALSKHQLNFYIIEPNQKKAYYFESKSGFKMEEGDNKISIKLVKAVELSDCILTTTMRR